MVEWIKARFQEKTTYAGLGGILVTVLTIFGVVVSPELKEGIMAAVAAIVSVVLVATKSK